MILRAIAWQESHNRPDAINKNANGSIDYGLMQINSIHLHELKKYNISRDDLKQGCKSVFIAAWHLRQKLNKEAYRDKPWDAVGAYHSETPALREKYKMQVHKIWVDLMRASQQTPSASTPTLARKKATTRQTRRMASTKQINSAKQIANTKPMSAAQQMADMTQQ